MNDFCDHLILEILKADLDIKTLKCICVVSKQFNKIIKEYIELLINNRFSKYEASSKFMEKLKDKNIELSKSELNIDKFLRLIVNFCKVSQLKKRDRYQHLLVDTYNSSLFIIGKNSNIDVDIEYVENLTLIVLMTFLDYVKGLDIMKTNLIPWGAYPFVEYIALILSNDKRRVNSIFLKRDNKKVLLSRINFIRHELKITRDCHQDIKFRLGRSLNYVSEELDASTIF